MALGDSRISTGLGLGLASLKEEETPLNFKINKKHGSRNHQMMMMTMKKKKPSSSSSLLMSFEPCLTLGLFSSSSEEYAVNKNSSNTEENNSDDVNYNRQGSDSDPPVSISTVSSPSNNNNNVSLTNIKRERAADRHGSSDREMEASRVNDEDEDCNNTIRKKLRLTREQSSLLEESFKQHSTLHPNQKQALASQLNLQPRQVEVWFQNRRARTKLKQTEVDCEFLKKCCETLTDENTRLQKEIQELKAIKASQLQQQQPFFMQLPAATLTICPSCERRGRNGSVVTTADGSPKKSFSMAASNNIKHLYCNPFTNPSTAC